jgi:hypothetical protein
MEGKMGKDDKGKLVMGIIAFGSLWGMLEATAGSILHYTLVLNAGAIMAAAGFFIMATAVAVYKKPQIAPYIGIVAASEKFLGFLIFPLSSWGQIARPAAGIFLESLAFGAVLIFFWSGYRKKIGTKVLCTAASSYLGFFLYALVGKFVFKGGIGNMDVPALMKHVISNATIIFIVSSFLVPAGSWVGDRIKISIERTILRNPGFYYGITGLVSVLCWVVSIITTIKGA